MRVDSSYYTDKLESLRALFGTTDLRVGPAGIAVNGRTYPVVGDVIVCLPPDKWPLSVATALRPSTPRRQPSDSGSFAEDIQYTFGEEWTRFDDIMPEHLEEFANYFRIVDLSSLRDARVCDLGCGIGRWSRYLAPHCREIVLTDFSDAVFAARRNLSDWPHAMFVMADVTELPFAKDAFGFVFSLGVLHHLPGNALDAVRRLAPLAPQLLIYLYYALDNRPAYFRWLLSTATALRRRLSRVRQRQVRDALCWVLTLGVYEPFIAAGHVANLVGAGEYVPLYETYKHKSVRRIRQDAYDRFFTRIEQRVSRAEIRTLEDTFREIRISSHIPYWTFLCRR